MTPVVPSARAGDRHGQFSRTGSSTTVAIRPPDLDLAMRPEVPPATPDHLVPNLLLAGVTHAGASALARSLGRHPDVKLPVVQRLDHYSPLRFGQPIQATLADYDRHFATWRGQRYRLERSPVYFDGGQELVDAVARDLPDVRVLILLRDPVQRLWTSYQDKVARGRLSAAMSYETYVEHCLALRVNGADRFEGNRYFRTLSSGLYVEHLDRWLTAFGDRVRVVFAEDLDRTPRAAVAGVFTWLGLDPDTARPRERGELELQERCPRAQWIAKIRETHKRCVKQTGVRVVDVEIVRLKPETDVAAFTPFLERAAALGARHVLVAGDDPDHGRLTETFGAFCALAAPFGLTGDLEFMPWTKVPDLATARGIVEAAGAPNGGVLVDAIHFDRLTTTLAEIRALPHSRVNYFQLCDGPGQYDPSPEGLAALARTARLFPGEGAIDLAGLIAALPRDVPVSVEVPSLWSHGRSPDEIAARAFASVRGVLDGGSRTD